MKNYLFRVQGTPVIQTVTVTKRPTRYSIVGGPIGSIIDYLEDSNFNPDDQPMPETDGHRYPNPPAAHGRRSAAPLDLSNYRNDRITRFRADGVPTYASSCIHAALFADACYEFVGNSLAVEEVAAQTVIVTETRAVPTTVPGQFRFLANPLYQWANLLLSTLLVCDSLNNYGHLYRAGYDINSRNQRGLAIIYPTFTAITTLQECCARCYQTVGCLIWYLDTANANACTFYMQARGDSRDTSTICPFGTSNVFAYTTDAGTATFGIGACGRYAGVPDA
jgi:hypothetical protein